MSSSASKKRKPNDDSQTIEETIQKKLPAELDTKIKLTQQFPNTRYDCEDFEIRIEYLPQRHPRLSVRMISPYEYRDTDYTRLNEEDSFNAVMGNICRAVNAGFKDIESPLLRDLSPSAHSPHAGQSGPKTQQETYLLNYLNKNLKRLPWLGCFWDFYFLFTALPLTRDEILQAMRTLISNVLNSIRTYNKKTLNNVKNTGREDNTSGAIKTTLHFQICKPKNSLHELIKKRLEKEKKKNLLKF